MALQMAAVDRWQTVLPADTIKTVDLRTRCHFLVRLLDLIMFELCHRRASVLVHVIMCRVCVGNKLPYSPHGTCDYFYKCPWSLTLSWVCCPKENDPQCVI